MFTFSDIYKDDLQDDAIFVLEYPSSHKDNFGNPLYLVNSSRYLVDDEFRCRDYESNRLEKPHRNLPVLGSRFRAYVAEPPPAPLVEHWQRRLGIDPPRYADLGDPAPHVCLFPLDDLPSELHSFDPDEHYHVYSKVFITEIDCLQAAVLNQLKIPSVLKVCRSSGGYGTWMINAEKDYEYWLSQIHETMPYAETILTEAVEDIEHHMCCHIYLSRNGDVRWIAVTEKIMDEGGIWIGAVMQFVYLSLSGKAPPYLADDILQLASEGHRRRLRSSTDGLCIVPRTYTTFGDRSFAAARPRVWNSLPAQLRDYDLSYSTQMSRQRAYERLVRKTTEPVSTALHARGFFGLFGVDVLVNSSGGQYVVDINPRVLGSSPLVFTQLGLEKLGRFWEVGIFLTKVLVKAESAESVVRQAEAVQGGEIIVYSLIDEGANSFRCQIAVFASSVAKCRGLAEEFYYCKPVADDN